MSFGIWHKYFQLNQDHFNHLDWNISESLIGRERKTITSSIQQFQRGEHSEGKHFMKFAETMKDISYINAVKLFIKEEQDHASVLGQFMNIHKIGKLKNDWLDNIFRWLRKLAGLEGTITVLLTAEIISMVYYKALQAATNSKLLGQICKQILIDEEMHLRFQSFTLKVLYERKIRPVILVSRLLHKTLMAGTIIMVWFCHGRVLSQGGYNLVLFFSAVWKEFVRCEQMIKDKEANLPVFKNINTAA